jgi:hypothetical protein
MREVGFAWKAYTICYKGSVADLESYFAKHPLILPSKYTSAVESKQGKKLKMPDTFRLSPGLNVAAGLRGSEAHVNFLLSLPAFDDKVRTAALNGALLDLTYTTGEQPPIAALLLDSHADINCTQYGMKNPLINAVIKMKPAAVAFLLDRGADILCPGCDVSPLHSSVMKGEVGPSRHINLMLLACGTDVKTAGMLRNMQVTADSKAILDYVDDYHKSVKLTLSEFAPVDTRVGRGSNGIYQEPMERVMEYLGLSMHQDQVFNATLDGSLTHRALIPGNAHNAWHWSEMHRAVPSSNMERSKASEINDL